MTNTLSLRGVLAGLLAAATLSAGAASPAAFDAAFAQFQRASAGEEAAVEPAAQQFAALSSAEPGDPVLLAYAGAAAALRSRSTLLPWKKMSYAEEGLAELDKALSLLTPAHDQPLHHGTPASLETRFVAASTFVALPSMFNRQQRGAKLLEDVLKSPLLPAAPLGFRGAVWLRAGLVALQDKRNDDAKRWFGEVIKSGAPQAARAQAKLKEMS